MKVYIIDNSEIYAKGLSSFIKSQFSQKPIETILMTGKIAERPFHPITSSRVLIDETVIIDFEIYQYLTHLNVFPFSGKVDMQLFDKLILLLDHPRDFKPEVVERYHCNGVLFRSMNREQIGNSLNHVFKRGRSSFYIDINYMFESHERNGHLLDDMFHYMNLIQRDMSPTQF